ncbi:hypothetical protein ACHAWF_011811 [Thalassiosira exigua]
MQYEVADALPAATLAVAAPCAIALIVNFGHRPVDDRRAEDADPQMVRDSKGEDLADEYDPGQVASGEESESESDSDRVGLGYLSSPTSVTATAESPDAEPAWNPPSFEAEESASRWMQTLSVNSCVVAKMPETVSLDPVMNSFAWRLSCCCQKDLASRMNMPPMPPSAGAASRHASPPQSSQQLSPTQRRSGGGRSSALLRILSVAIALVLAFHWYLVLHHVTYHAPDARGLRGWEGRGRRGARKTSDVGGSGKEPYVLSEICGGCRRSYSVRKHEPCHDLIQQRVRKHNETVRGASRVVGTTAEGCERCDPETCYDRHLDSSLGRKDGQYPYRTKYWRFDRAAPRVTSPTSPVFSSIPEELRVPHDRYNDIEAFLKAKYAAPDPNNVTNAVLFEYNPSLAPIPDRMRPYLPQEACYLLSLRVTPHNFCFPIWLTEKLSEDIKQTMHAVNHLGLALLDKRRRIIPGYDVVIDIDRQLDAKRSGFMGEPAFVDYRLFTLNDDIYLHVNSDTVILTKLKLRAKGTGGVKEEDAADVTKRNRKAEKQFRLKNLYGGDNLQVTLLHQFNTIWGEGKNAIFGKNYALFSIPNATHPGAPDAIYAEMNVFPEHKVQRIVPDEFDHLPKDLKIKWRQRRNFKIDHIIQRQMKKVGNATVSVSARGEPLPSFFTVDEHWFPGGKNPFKEFAHGGACCVLLASDDVPSAAHTGGTDLFVGVGHTLVKVSVDGSDSKHRLFLPEPAFEPYPCAHFISHHEIQFYTKNKMPVEERALVPDTNYVSFFYAFEPHPPFELRARSGYFCLGFASPSAEEGGTINRHSVLTHNRPLRQNNETFNCPQIHYVETVVEKVGDPKSVVIGYGMNDCTARLVEVTKAEISRMLFPDSLDMVIAERP